MDSGISVYDFNKQIYGKMTPMTGKVLESALSNVGAWFGINNGEKYFMLNNYELKWFTIFHLKPTCNYSQAYSNLKETLSNIGDVLAIEYQHDMHYYEIWVRSYQDNDVHMFVLFNCKDLVVEVN